MKSNTHKRFQAIMNYFRLTVLEFSNELGYERSEKVNRILNEKGFPSFEMLSDIKRTFPEVNLNWLVFGSGDMIEEKREGSVIVIRADENNSIIPYLPGGFHKAYIDQFKDPSFVSGFSSLDNYSYNDGVYRDFECTSDNLSPEIRIGDIVRGVFKTSYNNIDPYVIIANTGVYFDKVNPIKHKPILELWKIIEVRKRH